MDDTREISALTGLSVLVVEDDNTVYDFVEDVLKDVGVAEIRRARDIAEANKAISERSPDIAILDINLKGHPVYPVAVKLDDSKVPVIFATAYEKSTLPQFWRDRPILEKPFTASRVISAINEALNRKRP